MAVVSWIVDFHDKVLEDWGDRRADNFLLMGSAWEMLALVAFYLYVSVSLGPRLMKDRKPFDITSIIFVYNIAQVIVCAWLFILGTIYVLPSFHILCEPLDYTPTPRNLLIIKITHQYFLLKIVDLVETIFFVLKRNSHQITFLHLYHHASMVIGAWLQCRFYSVGATACAGYVNCFVHTFMYGYYALTIFFKPSQLAWLKQRITQLQLAQFILVTVIITITIINPNCNYPKSIGIPYIINGCWFMYLFSRFYYETYIKAKGRSNERKKE